ncbi:MAG: hypothetical protein KatS3mg094_225 [Candidatus Parcubacteria bacterium]|nr:MAG: hypothetical protein KatS3mg094_225 [Candidatus Parcubacteria bacterium]
MKKYALFLIIFIGISFVSAQTTQVDQNLLNQIGDILQKLSQQYSINQQAIQEKQASINFLDILQKLIQQYSINQTQPPIEIEEIQEKQITEIEKLLPIPAPKNLPKGIQPVIPATQTPLTPNIFQKILPDEIREDDAIVQLNNLRITRIIKEPGIENTKAILFAVRDISWKCLMFESEDSEISLPCALDLRRQILFKELTIKITDDTILLQRNRQRSGLDDFNVGDKINVYGFMDKDNYGIEALIVRKIISTSQPPKEAKLRVISPNGGEVWPIDSYQKIKWVAPKDKTVSIYLKPYIACLYTQPACSMPELMLIIIAENIPNTGEYQWQGQTTLQDKTLDWGYYLIEIIGDQSKESDMSDKPFEIIPKSSLAPEKPESCIQVIAPAYNPQNPSECKEFPTPCDVPEGWIRTNKCSISLTTTTQSTVSLNNIKELKVEADDYGFYPASIKVPRNTKVILYLIVKNQNVYYGGLDFRSKKFKTEPIKPGQSTKVEFTTDESFVIESYWPLSNVKKSELKVIVK